MFRPRYRLARPALSYLCTGGPSGPRLPVPPRCHPVCSEGSAFSSCVPPPTSPARNREFTPSTPSRTTPCRGQVFLVHSSRIASLRSLSPVESALPQNAYITRLESALPKTQHLKSFRIRTYGERGRGALVTTLSSFLLVHCIPPPSHDYCGAPHHA